MSCLLRSSARCLSGPESVRRPTGAARARAGFGFPPATVYKFGRRHIGHIHMTGVAELSFPRAVHDQLISDGRAKPPGAGFAGVVSYHIREPEDVPKVVELFRMCYDRAKGAAERRKERTEHRYSHDEQGQRSA